MALAVNAPSRSRKEFTDFPKDATLVWKPFKSEVARSGDLGYTLGTYELSGPGPDGKPTTKYGKYCSVWKKQKDGTWKWVVGFQPQAFAARTAAENFKPERAPGCGPGATDCSPPSFGRVERSKTSSPLLCDATASPSSRLLASDPTALATPPHTLFQQPASGSESPSVRSALVAASRAGRNR